MSHSIENENSEFDLLLKWVGIIMLVAIVPHYLAQMGFLDWAQNAAMILFPMTMGPLSILQCCMVVNSLGFTTHMAWLFAMLIALIWSGIILAMWRWKSNLAAAIYLISLIVSVIWIRGYLIK